ncbi:hypothetical protein MP638_002728 [Amoeboaphelidium occidentale]|nr:hypothetical protein MP638_002728 [Amoeboaphelidium occidentale]
MKKINFIHPDLGIGGAERLIIDFALALENVTIYTSHHDQERSFKETTSGEFDIKVYGDISHPKALKNKFLLLFAVLRNLVLTVRMLLDKISSKDEELFIVDQIPVSIPLIKLFRPRSKVLFYCHFPDQLLSKRDSMLKKIYRILFDYMEEFCIYYSDLIVVNSNYTLGVVRDTFRSLADRELQVVYPSFQLPSVLRDGSIKFRKYNVVSINRYEDKKNVALLLRSVHMLKQRLKPEEFRNILVIIAGGFDERVEENVINYKKLIDLCVDYGLIYSESAAGISDNTEVLFLKNISDGLKDALLRPNFDEQEYKVLVYTPEFEHFGIGPLEGMGRGSLVIAMGTGGPTESVDKKCGFLIYNENREEGVSEVLMKVVQGQIDLAAMGNYGKEYVRDKFGMKRFQKEVNEVVKRLDSLEVYYTKWYQLITVFLTLISVGFIVVFVALNLML